MSDITRLVTLGVIVRDIEVDGFKFKLRTPSADSIKGVEISDIVSQFVIEIDGKGYTGAEDKKALGAVLAQTQSGIVSKLVEICNGMLAEQSDLVEGFFSKK